MMANFLNFQIYCCVLDFVAIVLAVRNYKFRLLQDSEVNHKCIL